ncbi:MAG: tetratricopeptide repeat protein, partial [Gammaproteobacteria bacterium]|nr:tetratricopeptide repeat protein [Gammaproteobacteria bacterium]
MQDKYSAFFALSQAAKSDAEREWLLLRFTLDNLSDTLRAAVWAAAVPHWFDFEFLNALLDEDKRLDTEQFTQFIDLAFVSKPLDAEVRLIHERTRTPLLEKFWQKDPARYRKLSDRAAKYCKTQDQGVPLWRIETVYHQLVAEPEKGVDLFINTGWEWQNPPNFAYDKVESMARVAREHANAGRLTKHGVTWTLFWEAHLDKIYSRNYEAKAKLMQIRPNRNSHPYTAACCLESLGDVHLQLSELPDARGRYEEALQLYQKTGSPHGEANCLKSLGNVHLQLSELPDARGRYEEALPLYQKTGAKLGEANCLRSLGDVHLRLSELPDARGRYEEALPLYQKTGS